MSEVDPYAVLGLPRNATPPQVARARRRLAKRHHPDVHRATDATARMRRINQAWQILSNPVRRADYDRRHPRGGSGRYGHWRASRAGVRPAAPNSSRSSATWRRPAAAAARTATRPAGTPGGRGIPRTGRSARGELQDAGFRDSGWAALLAAAVMLLFLLLAALAGNMPT